MSYGILQRRAFPFEEGNVTHMTAAHFKALRPEQVESLLTLERGGEAVFIQDAEGMDHRLRDWFKRSLH